MSCQQFKHQEEISSEKKLKLYVISIIYEYNLWNVVFSWELYSYSIEKLMKHNSRHETMDNTNSLFSLVKTRAIKSNLLVPTRSVALQQSDAVVFYETSEGY